ncbi:MAG TPA: hypothetical protein DCL61_24850, partial [Cyanobacteria bacterium UBA12227]|nr:hypothetical protein [Cyanobacteria bacterium UBA12227]
YCLKQYQHAIEYCQQALTLYREVGDHKRESYCLTDLGLAYYFLEQYQQAIETLQQALILYREIGDRLGEGRTLGNLGSAY